MKTISKGEIFEHYSRPEVKKIILEWCNIKKPEKAQRSLVASHRGWYRYRENKDGEAPQEKALVPATEEGYDMQIKRMERQGDRSLYHSLNYFEPSVFQEWVDHWPHEDKEEESPGGYKETVFYGLGTDIDLKDKEKVEGLEQDRSVTIAEDREWLERAIKFHVDWLTDHGISGKIISPYFSGNGAYITLNPEVIKFDCEPQKAETICRAYNHVIKQIEKEFFEENPEAKDYVQFDALNNSKRQWKTPLSVHKSKPFACIPFLMERDSLFNDAHDEPIIELEKAKLPLSGTVIGQAEMWVEDKPSVDAREGYTKQVGELLQEPILKDGDHYKTPKKAAKEEIVEDTGLNSSKEPLDVDIELANEEAIPPCIQKLLNAETPLSHARGKGLLAFFFYKIGLDKDEAKGKWTKLCNAAGGPKTNIFESWWEPKDKNGNIFDLPSCETIQGSGQGYPYLEMGDIGLCDPDKTCEEIKSLREYVEKNTGEEIEAELIPSQVNASKVGLRVRLRGRIEAQKVQKALPKKAEISCRRCGKSVKMETHEWLKKRLIFKGKKSTYSILKDRGKQLLPEGCDPNDERKTHNPIITPSEYLDYSIIWINDLLEDMAAFQGDKSSTIKTVLIGEELPNTRKVALEGKLEVDPRNEDIVLLADKVETIGTLPDSVELSAEELHYYTNALSEEGVYSSSLLNQVAPDLIGRDLVKESRLLTLHSPHLIPDIDGDKNIRGSLRECLFGDTKTGKSMSMKDTTKDYYKFGDYASAETGSRAGLIYSVDTDKKTLSWGTLPLNDLGYVGIDGLNKLHSEEMKEFREVLEDQRVVVRKFVSGEALARVRITACMNPPEPMNHYVTPIQAINDTYIFQKTPDITRWDIFIPFYDSDVEKDTIIDKEAAKRPLDKEIFIKHVYWVWSRDPEDITFSQTTCGKIRDIAKKIVNKYHTSKVPIVHNGIRDTVTRLSVAYACLTHSSNDNETITVEPEHVDLAKDFYIRMLEKLHVKEFKELTEDESVLEKEEILNLVNKMDETHADIVKTVSIDGATSSSKLANRLNVSVSTVKNKYELLKNHEIIETKPGKGVILTDKGTKFIRILLGMSQGNAQNISAIVQNSNTNSPSQEEIIEKILKFYNEYGDPEWTVAEFLDPLTEHFEDLDREELRPHVERLKEEGNIILSPEVGEVEDLEVEPE